MWNGLQVDLDGTDCQMIAENSYKFIKICRNKCPCPNGAEQNKQIYLTSSFYLSRSLMYSKGRDVFYTAQGSCGATAALWFCSVKHKLQETFIFLLFIIFRNNLD